MKLALLLPGYLDSPETPYMLTFETGLKTLGFTVERLDPCDLWKSDIAENYNATNYLKTIEDTLNKYANENLDEVIIIGHSLGGFMSIIAGNHFAQITKVVSLCAPSDLQSLGKTKIEESFKRSTRPIPNKANEFRTFNIPIDNLKDAMNYSALEDIKTLNKPVMIYIALDDETVPPENTELLVKGAKNAHVVKQKNMGHGFIYSEELSKCVFKSIRIFLEEN